MKKLNIEHFSNIVIQTPNKNSHRNGRNVHRNNCNNHNHNTRNRNCICDHNSNLKSCYSPSIDSDGSVFKLDRESIRDSHVSTKIQFSNLKYAFIFHIFHISRKAWKNNIILEFPNRPHYDDMINYSQSPFILDLPPNKVSTKQILLRSQGKTKHERNHNHLKIIHQTNIVKSQVINNL